MICACFGVGLDVIREALASGRRANVEEIGTALRAGTNCGSCLPELRRIVIMTVMLANTRTPSEAQPPRMEALARLPVFFALDGKRAVVAGGTPAAAWKAELLVGGGRGRRCLRAEPCEEMLALAADPPRGTTSSIAAPGRLDDIRGAAIAVGACETDDEATHFAAAARAAGVPVNVIDKPAFCDFSFGAIVNRSPLVIGISTDGAAPVFGQAIRAKLEALIPRGFARWAEAARRWRSAVKTSGLSFNGRRRFWQIFTAHAVAQSGPRAGRRRITIGC